MNEKENNNPMNEDGVIYELQEKADWLNEKIDEAILHAKKLKRTNQKRASYVKIISVLFTGLITILLGLQIEGYAESFKAFAFVLGAFVTVINALEPFFNFRALWIEHEAALANFHRLKDSLEFYLIGLEPEKLEKNELEELNEKYQQIWVDLSRTWIEYRRGEGSSG